MGDVVGEVVVGGEDDSPVVVVASQQVVERVEFLPSGAGDFLGTLLGDEGTASMRVVGCPLQELLVTVFFPDVEVVVVHVVAVNLVLLVVLFALLGCEVDLQVNGFVLTEVLPGEFVDVLLVDDGANQVFQYVVLPVSAFVGSGQSESRSNRHFGNLLVGRGR